MEKGDKSWRQDMTGRGTEQSQNKIRQSNHEGSEPMEKQERYLGFITKKKMIMVSATVALFLLIIIMVTAVVLTKESGSSALHPSFSTGGHMLDFLVQTGEISKPDGLLATWFHRANKKEEMNKALASDAMILEADVTLDGYGTPSEKPIPIMAHPPEIYSDNTLDQWLDVVLASKKGVKLDFKSLESVGLSLDLLCQKNNSQGINRPVWINADILQGPNVPDFLPPVNGTRFLQLIQEKFSDVTLSPGWKVAYGPPLFTETYTRSMVEDMNNLIRDFPQKVTFPVHALLVRSGWQHISWLLSQSPRFSLTLWQGSIHPNVSDLLFIRDNTHPARVYYDIYEPTLSAFKQAASQQGSLRRFYPGGNLMDFLCQTHNSNTKFLSKATQCSSVAVHWFTVTDQTSLMAQLTDGTGGMLVVQVSSDSSQLGVPLVESSGKSSETLTLQKYVSTVERLFPYITIVLKMQNWPPQIPSTVANLSQRVGLYLNKAYLPNRKEELHSLMGMMNRCDLIVEKDTKNNAEALKELTTQQTGRANTNLYVISDQS
nr:PREDICTED: protein FAM151A isoform X2 [Paralichthys olivaceus]